MFSYCFILIVYFDMTIAVVSEKPSNVIITDYFDFGCLEANSQIVEVTTSEYHNIFTDTSSIEYFDFGCSGNNTSVSEIEPVAVPDNSVIEPLVHYFDFGCRTFNTSSENFSTDQYDHSTSEQVMTLESTTTGIFDNVTTELFEEYFDFGCRTGNTATLETPVTEPSKTLETNVISNTYYFNFGCADNNEKIFELSIHDK